MESSGSTGVTNPLLMDTGEEAVGLIKENGEINWDCPCLQGMGSGPCGEEFKDAFSCFHYSESEPKGSDCLAQFQGMQECFQEHPEVYGALDDDLKENEDTEKLETGIQSGTETLSSETESEMSEQLDNVSSGTA